MTVATVVGAALNVGLNALFIPKFGFIAAGYTTLACYILYALAHYYYMRKVCKQFMGGTKVYNVKIILALGLGLLLCAFAIMLLYETTWIRYGLVAVIGLGLFWKRKTIISMIGTLKSK